MNIVFRANLVFNKISLRNKNSINYLLCNRLKILYNSNDATHSVLSWLIAIIIITSKLFKNYLNINSSKIGTVFEYFL